MIQIAYLNVRAFKSYLYSFLHKPLIRLGWFEVKFQVACKKRHSSQQTTTSKTTLVLLDISILISESNCCVDLMQQPWSL